MFRISLLILFFHLLNLKIFSQVLETPEVIKVSYNISNNNVDIFWKSTPDAASYEVWYADDQLTAGTVSYQKVPGSNRVSASLPQHMEFEHVRALVSSMGYFITAFDNGKGKSRELICDSTVFLKTEFDSCLASATLSWNDYNKWRGHMEGYKVFGSTDGVNYNLLQNLPNTANECIINNLNAYQLYSFYVLAFRNNPSDSSYSNRVDVNTNMAANPSFIHANFGTAESGHPVVSFAVDPASELNNYILLRSASPAIGFDSITTINTNNKTVVFSDNSVSTSEAPYHYKLNAINNCKQVIRSSDNIAGTIFLQTGITNKSVNLNWNSYENWTEGVNHYSIERNQGGTGYETITSTSELSYIDHSFENSGSQPTESEVCYRITAYKNPTTAEPSTSISNEACIILGLNIRFEFDAFVPGSAENSTFGPAMDFVPSSLTFSIFNRWGNLLFESTDPYNLSWDGLYKGNKVDQGVYRYQLEYTSENGKKSVMHGNVTVVYP